MPEGLPHAALWCAHCRPCRAPSRVRVDAAQSLLICPHWACYVTVQLHKHGTHLHSQQDLSTGCCARAQGQRPLRRRRGTSRTACPRASSAAPALRTLRSAGRTTWRTNARRARRPPRHHLLWMERCVQHAASARHQRLRIAGCGARAAAPTTARAHPTCGSRARRAAGGARRCYVSRARACAAKDHWYCSCTSSITVEARGAGASDPENRRGARAQVLPERPECRLASVNLVSVAEPTMHIARFLPSIRDSPAPLTFVWHVRARGPARPWSAPRRRTLGRLGFQGCHGPPRPGCRGRAGARARPPEPVAGLRVGAAARPARGH